MTGASAGPAAIPTFGQVADWAERDMSGRTDLDVAGILHGRVAALFARAVALEAAEIAVPDPEPAAIGGIRMPAVKALVVAAALQQRIGSARPELVHDLLPLPGRFRNPEFPATAIAAIAVTSANLLVALTTAGSAAHGRAKRFAGQTWLELKGVVTLVGGDPGRLVGDYIAGWDRWFADQQAQGRSPVRSIICDRDHAPPPPRAIRHEILAGGSIYG